MDAQQVAADAAALERRIRASRVLMRTAPAEPKRSFLITERDDRHLCTADTVIEKPHEVFMLQLQAGRHMLPSAATFGQMTDGENERHTYAWALLSLCVTAVHDMNYQIRDTTDKTLLECEGPGMEMYVESVFGA